MRAVCLLIAFISLFTAATAQVPIPMAIQPSLTYISTFDSIASWSNNFSSGHGAAHFASVATGGTATIPNATKVTTSSAAFVTGSTGGLYRDTANDRLIMLVTGTTNNSSSLAVDVFLDFTGVNAGTLSFDWATVFNGANTSNRTGTLKVYASVDGVSFTELPGAEVTVKNYVTGNGNVSNVQLPSSFDNTTTCRLRFYYYNSAGGSSGSRPKIAIDNIKVTAVGSPCATPQATPSGLTFSNTTATSVQGSFTAANPAPDEYLIVATMNGSLSSYPVDGMVYKPGDTLGDGFVVYRGSATAFAAGGLSPLTAYTFYVFPLNLYCNGIPMYNTGSPLTAAMTTPAGPPCATPASQPTTLQFSNITTTSIQGTFIPANGTNEYLVVAATTSGLTSHPVDGMVYNPGDIVGGGTVVYRGGMSSFTATGLSHSTTYHFFIYSLNSYACSNGPAYLTTSPLTGQAATGIILPCTTPVGNASSLVLTAGSNHIAGFFTPFNTENDGYLVVMSTSNALSALPQDGMSYSIGSSLGGGTAISTGNNYSFVADNLLASTTYYFFIISYNDICIGGPLYKTNSYLAGSASTSFNLPYNYYFGNLHAHSSYSDGNRDSSTLTPIDDYTYAANSLCMDFLGISDHNHFTATSNPGMLLAKYHQGLADAASFNATNPGFLALYGMEWGVQNNGGHILIYGIDQLIGWDTVSGSPNYDIYVPKTDYTSSNGLFRKINSFHSNNAFATLAHPGWSDFQYLAFNAFSKRADSAISGIAIESGPAFSTDTSYNSPGSNMSFLPYYEQMLSKGYHVAPMIDHDNHNTTFGRTSSTRTAVLSPSLDKSDFLHAMKNRRFYATQDCDSKVDLLVSGEPMGSIISRSFAPAITIRIEDPTNATTAPTITLKYGTPGSGIPSTVLATTTGNALSFTDRSLSNDSTAYYYADIMLDGKRIITAPVWYTRKDTFVVNSVTTPAGYANTLRIRNNPARSELNVDVDIHQSTLVQLSIYNIEGKIVYTRTERAAKGLQSYILPIQGLAEGTYVLELVTDQGRIRKKFTHLE